jgi:amylosucrase
MPLLPQMTLSRIDQEADLSLQRLHPKLAQFWVTHGVAVESQHSFEARLQIYWRDVYSLLRNLYGHRYDFFFHLEEILLTTADAWRLRSDELKTIDHQRMNDLDWFASEQIVGGALYVDLFSENLGKLAQSIDYFQELGITYLHLMPLFAVRPGDNDGGYAISNYRSIDPRLGTIDDLRNLSSRLREAGILLVLDFVLNHTSDDHQWALRAQSGSIEYQDFYFIFPDRTLPDHYELSLREIFPSSKRGNFTWHDGMQSWVWTTFNSYQWDLNYSNPAVFTAMLSEMFFIAGTGVDILRLDAVAFIWKELGTNSENRPQTHLLVQALNRLARIAAPGLLFKSEAIVHPDDVVKYISPRECQISYNPTLMALLWESMATRDVRLLHRSLSHRHQLPDHTAWVNYLRCHDDIGWTFDDADAAALGINAFNHRQFLNQFYTGQFPGSFARGIPFQYNGETGDMRIAGTLASLAGLESALESGDEVQIDFAVKRILLLQAITLSIGGIPLLYLGEEWGMLNDYDFVKDPAKSQDTRWVHRPKMKWEFLESLQESLDGKDATLRRRIFRSLQKMIQIRKSLPAFSGQEMELIATDNKHLLGFVRLHEGHRVITVANFSESRQSLAGNALRTTGMGRFFEDAMTKRVVGTSEEIQLAPYEFYWLVRC